MTDETTTVQVTPQGPPPPPPPAPPLSAPPVPAPTSGQSVFPSFTDRMQQTLTRYRTRPFTFLLLSALYLVFPSAVAIVLAVSGGVVVGILGGSKVLVIVAAVIGMIIMVLISAMLSVAIAATAAFKTPVVGSIRTAIHYTLASLLVYLFFICTTTTTLLFLIVPGVILAMRFFLYLPVILNERRTGFEALLRSRDLVFGKTKNLFGEMLAGTVILGFINALIAGVVTIGLGLVLPEALKDADLPQIIGTSLATVAVIPIGFIYLQLFYEHAIAGEKVDWAPNPKLARVYRIRAAIGGLLVFALPVIIAIAVPSLVAGLSRTHDGIEMPEITSTEPEKTEAELRDIERFRTVTALRVALGSYVRDRGTYPDTLGALVPQYLEREPRDPLSGGPYAYEKTSTGFKIMFTLEEGTDSLFAGEHTLGKDGFDPDFSQESSDPSPTDTASTIIGGAEPTDTQGTEVTPDSGNDQDSDGLGDEYEIANGLDPNSPDSDRDGLPDGQELRRIGTDPRLADTDGDGFGDGEEIYAGFDPLVPDATLPDLDGDGLADLYEELNGMDGGDPDMDDDGLSDGDEVRVFGTDPWSADTDSDGYTDTNELKNGFEPLGEGSLSDSRRAEIEQAKRSYGTYPPTDPTL